MWTKNGSHVNHFEICGPSGPKYQYQYQWLLRTPHSFTTHPWNYRCNPHIIFNHWSDFYWKLIILKIEKKIGSKIVKNGKRLDNCTNHQNMKFEFFCSLQVELVNYLAGSNRSLYFRRMRRRISGSYTGSHELFSSTSH